MPTFDLIVRNGMIVTERGTARADLAIAGGRFVEVGADVPGTARDVLDLDGCTILPGAIDPHVHFNEPGRDHWEGWQTGSAALVAGGTTTCIEMPLNAHPPTLDAASFHLRAQRAAESSRVDFALWGGLTPGNLDELHDLANAGAIGFKASMAPSDLDDFPWADDYTLLAGMRIAAALGLPVAVHAENEAIITGLAAAAVAQNRLSVEDYLASRPVVTEIEAIGRAITLAEETGCSLHIVHVSTGRGVTMVAAAQERGVDVTCETCPHYLIFTEEDAERIGALAKCAPPLRDATTQEELWAALLAGDIDLIASDHSPVPPEMKVGADFFAIWGGIEGCQHLLPALITAGRERGLTLGDVARLSAGNVARRFRLIGKGGIVVGNDADFSWGTFVDPAPIPLDEVQYRHPHSIWDDYPVAYRIEGTAVRGSIVYRDGKVIGRQRGHLIRPHQPGEPMWPFDDRD